MRNWNIAGSILRSGKTSTTRDAEGREWIYGETGNGEKTLDALRLHTNPWSNNRGPVVMLHGGEAPCPCGNIDISIRWYADSESPFSLSLSLSPLLPFVWEIKHRHKQPVRGQRSLCFGRSLCENRISDEKKEEEKNCFPLNFSRDNALNVNFRCKYLSSRSLYSNKSFIIKFRSISLSINFQYIHISIAFLFVEIAITATYLHSSLPIDHYPRFSSTVPRAKIHPLRPSVLLCAAATLHDVIYRDAADPMYFRHFTRVLSSMDADSSRWSIARSARCLFTVDTGLQREVINYRLTRVNGERRKEREDCSRCLQLIDAIASTSESTKRIGIFFENGEIFHRHFVSRVFIKTNDRSLINFDDEL